MQEPKFTVGEVVYHSGKRARGTVTKVFPSDFDHSEATPLAPYYAWQYYVEHSGYTWSVPEFALFKYTRKPHPPK